MAKNKQIEVKGIEVKIKFVQETDYISLTDIARYKEAQHTDNVISNWLRNRNTIELLGLWESLHNPNFKPIEFDGFRKQAGLNSFILTPKKWVENTGAIGIFSKSGRYGGTYAHKDIAFEFASWVSVEFKLYLIKEFQRLKADENDRLQLDWNLQRTPIKERLIPPQLTPKQKAYIYASEADILNVALFGKTAAQWRSENPDIKGNMRDEATLEQLVVLSNLESINAVLIRQGLNQQQRIEQLNQIAINQMTSLLKNTNLKRLK